MVKKINKRQALALLAAVVEEAGPDHVDPLAAEGTGCKYVVDGKPMCIVGRALAKAGVPLERIENGDYRNGQTISLRSDLEDVLSEGAYEVFIKVQRRQDQGFTWGEALGYATAF